MFASSTHRRTVVRPAVRRSAQAASVRARPAPVPQRSGWTKSAYSSPVFGGAFSSRSGPTPAYPITCSPSSATYRRDRPAAMLSAQEEAIESGSIASRKSCGTSPVNAARQLATRASAASSRSSGRAGRVVRGIGRWSVGLLFVGGLGFGEALAGAVQPALARAGKFFAALPQCKGFLEAGAAGFEFADHVDKLLASLLVGHLGSVAAHLSSSDLTSTAKRP